MAQNAGKVVTFSNNNQANMADSVTGSMGQGGGQSIRSYDQSSLSQNFGVPQQSGANLDSTVVPGPHQQAAPVARIANDHVDSDQTKRVKDDDNNLLESKSNGDEPQNLVGDALVARIGGDNELKVEFGRDSPVNGLIYNEDDYAVDNSENGGNLVANGNDKIAGDVSSNVNQNLNIAIGELFGALGQGPSGLRSIGGQAILEDPKKLEEFKRKICEIIIKL